MILSITDGIEVAEHTEPQEREAFWDRWFASNGICPILSEPSYPMPETLSVFLSRQAE